MLAGARHVCDFMLCNIEVYDNVECCWTVMSFAMQQQVHVQGMGAAVTSSLQHMYHNAGKLEFMSTCVD